MGHADIVRVRSNDLKGNDECVLQTKACPVLDCVISVLACSIHQYWHLLSDSVCVNQSRTKVSQLTVSKIKIVLKIYI